MTDRISEMTFREFDQRRKDCHTVILPTGAVEGYGPHLPMASDLLVVVAVAVQVAQRTGAMIGPSLPVGDSRSISVFPGTLCVRPESFKAYLDDVVESLLGWGIRHFLFLNGHAGNAPIIAQISNDHLVRDPGLRFAQIDWWRYAAQHSAGVLENSSYMANGHASECGTSVMLYLYPELVRTDRLIRSVPKVVNGQRFPGVNRYTLFNEFSDDCMIGDATTATAEKGREIVERCVEDIVAYMQIDFSEK